MRAVLLFGVVLSKRLKVKKHLVHRLVCQAFVPNTQNLPQVNHRDENKQNNCASNLEYCTAAYNINYGTRNQKISKQVMCIETSVIYASASEVQRQLGFAKQNISSACRGKSKTSNGFHWRYVE